MLDQRFIGRINTDDADRDLKNTDIRDCLNLIPQIGGNTDSPRRESVKGTKLIFSDLPSGTNVTVGEFEDKSQNQTFFFNHNSNNNHGIYLREGGSVFKLIESSLLNFTTSTVISGAGVIDDTLVWTDGDQDIRSINFKRAKITNSSVGVKEWEVIVDITATNFLTTASTITIVELSSTSNVVLSAPVTETNIDAQIDIWTTSLNNNSAISAERCGNNIKLTELVAGNITSITATGIVEVAAINHYILPYTKREITLINEPPQCEPTFELVGDATVNVNFIDEKQFQFRTRYVYFDNAKSTLSPISGIAFTKGCGNSISKTNRIDLTFNTAPYTQRELTLIRHVEIFLREGNTGLWKRVVTLDRNEYFQGRYKFYNDGNYNVISDLDSNKLFDAVPDKANSLAIIDNRLFVGGITEGHDTPCVEAKLNPDIDDNDPNVSENLWTINGFLRIINQFLAAEPREQYAQNQVIYNVDDEDNAFVFGGFLRDFILGIPTFEHVNDIGDKYNQFIPEGGFTIFLAGTDFRATTTQAFREGLPVVSTTPLVFQANTSSERSDIGTAIVEDSDDAVNKGFSTFSMTGVKPGRYRLRVASHLVYSGDSSNDTGGAGSDYQINNTLKWQRTSANVYNAKHTEAASPVFPNRHEVDVPFNLNKGSANIFEVDIELGPEGGTFIVPDTITIEDMSSPKLLSGSAANQFYFRDTAGVLDNEEEIGKSTSVEGAIVQMKQTGTLTTSFKTDHNGYGWHSIFFELIGGFAIIRLEINISIFIGKSFNAVASYQGKNLTSISTGTVTDVSSQIDLSSLKETTEWVILTDNSDPHSDSRTQIRGKILDINGVPVSGALVTVNGTNESDETDSTGNYEILVYSETPGDTRNATVFINTNASACVIDDDPLDPLKKIVLALTINSTNFNNLFINHKVIDDLILNVISLANSTFIKRGGVYQWGILYYDDYLRSSFVATDATLKLNIPFYTEDLGIYYPDKHALGTFRFGNPIINWEINSPPPSFATRYKWVRTKNTAYNSYLHWVAHEIRYVRSIQNSGTDTEFIDDTVFANGDAKEIYISIENILLYQEENTDSQVGYTFEQGDKLIIIRNNNQNLTEYIDVPVLGTRGNFIIIEALGIIPELFEGMLFQVYTPKLKNEFDIYYEITTCYDIIGGFHQGPDQNQTDSLPAKGLFSDGDTYKLDRSVPTDNGVSNLVFDSASISDAVTTQDSDIGRVNIEDKKFTEIFRFGTVRFGNPFIQDSFTNGIPSFDALDEEVLGFERGIIRKMIATTNNILVIHERESTVLRIREAFLNTPDGAGQLTQTEKIIGDQYELKGEFGTLNPESVVEYDDVIYWYDANKSEPIRYSINGLTPIGKNLKAKKFFLDIQQSREDFILSNPTALNRVYGGYDPIRQMYIVTFNDLGDNKQDTIGFSEDYNYWSTRFSFIPEHYTKLGNKLFAFKDGDMWELNADDNNHNKFFGVQYPASFKIISNLNNEFEKIYRNVGIKSNVLWDVPVISNREGQLSDLLKSNFVRRDDSFYADILRNSNTNTDTLTGIQTPLLHGEVMRSQVMTFEIKTDVVGKIFIEQVFFGFQESPGHLIDR